MEQTSYVGTGLASPITLVRGKPVINTNAELINDSIADILSTPIGSKLFLPEFGSRLQELTFEPNDEVVKSMIRLFVYEALNKWEKRINLADIKFEVSGALIDCYIEYRILSKHDIDTFIYPFYRKLNY